jgi:hypothetical protein
MSHRITIHLAGERKKRKGEGGYGMRLVQGVFTRLTPEPQYIHVEISIFMLTGSLMRFQYRRVCTSTLLTIDGNTVA